jgi:alkylhydroperoxidase family enzyme
MASKAKTRAQLVAELRNRVLDGPGTLRNETRRAAFSGAELPGTIGAYVDKVRHCAYDVTDDDVAAVRAAGLSEDEVFELTIAAALGAGTERLDAGLRAMGQAPA